MENYVNRTQLLWNEATYKNVFTFRVIDYGDRYIEKKVCIKHRQIWNWIKMMRHRRLPIETESENVIQMLAFNPNTIRPNQSDFGNGNYMFLLFLNKSKVCRLEISILKLGVKHSMNIYVFDRNLKYMEPNRKEVEIAESILHPNYRYPVLQYDIAIIRLKDNLKFVNKKIQPIALPDKNDIISDGELSMFFEISSH